MNVRMVMSFATAIVVLSMAQFAVAESEPSLFDDLKKQAGDAADAVGQAAAKATDQVNETIDTTRKSLRDEATPEQTRAKLDEMSEATLKRLFQDQPATRDLFEASYGYAVFNTRQVAMVLAGAYGRGVAVNRETDAKTYMKMGSAGVGMGFGVGGFDVQVVIFFENAFTFNTFITQGLDATAEATTLAGSDKEDLRVGFQQGRASFVLTKDGWQVSAKLLGSKYWPDEALNERAAEAQPASSASD